MAAFTWEKKEHRHHPSGYVIIERAVTSGCAPGDFSRFVAGLVVSAEQVGIRGVPPMSKQIDVPGESIAEAFEWFIENFEEVFEKFKKEVRQAVLRAPVIPQIPLIRGKRNPG